MARGVKFGRKHKLTPHQQQEAKRRRDAGESLSERPVARGELPDDRPSLTTAYARFAGFGRL